MALSLPRLEVWCLGTLCIVTGCVFIGCQASVLLRTGGAYYTEHLNQPLAARPYAAFECTVTDETVAAAHESLGQDLFEPIQFAWGVDLLLHALLLLLTGAGLLTLAVHDLVAESLTSCPSMLHMLSWRYDHTYKSERLAVQLLFTLLRAQFVCNTLVRAQLARGLSDSPVRVLPSAYRDWNRLSSGPVSVALVVFFGLWAFCFVCDIVADLCQLRHTPTKTACNGKPGQGAEIDPLCVDSRPSALFRFQPIYIHNRP